MEKKGWEGSPAFIGETGGMDGWMEVEWVRVEGGDWWKKSDKVVRMRD